MAAALREPVVLSKKYAKKFAVEAEYLYGDHQKPVFVEVSCVTCGVVSTLDENSFPPGRASMLRRVDEIMKSHKCPPSARRKQ
jgi:hypothetical protein